MTVEALPLARPAEALVSPVTSVKNDYEVIVIGAGILGAALATQLARDGRDVLLIERDWREPDRIVGELLQPGGIKALRSLGLQDCTEDIDAIEVHGYVIFNNRANEQAQLPYPRDNREPRHAGLPQGRSFHHGRFVNRLRLKALAEPHVTCIAGTASSLIPCPATDRILGVRVTFKDLDGTSLSKNFFAPLTVVADGCFSKFRKQYIDKDVHSKSNFAGLVLKDCALPFPNHGHVVLAEPSPILLYQIGTHDTRILVDIPGKLPSATSGDLNKYMTDFVMPQLPASTRPSFLEALKADRVRSMPNCWLPPSTNTAEGMIMLGDAMNMRHPLTGGGMTVALWDVVHFSNLLKHLPALSVSHESQSALSSAMQTLHWKRKGLSSVINILAQALYELFAAGDDPHMLVLQEACFGYLKKGGRCTNTPVGLLAGIIPEPLTLVGHFFAVAWYGMGMMILREPLWKLPYTIVQCVIVLWTAVTVIGPVILSEIMP